MNKPCGPGKAFCRKWLRIHLVDKCLLIILSILMVQSAISLFVHESMNQETSPIDVVVRTSAAGIFGYLISTNFDQGKKRGVALPTDSGSALPTAPAVSPPAAPAPDAPRNQIGFVTPGPALASGGAQALPGDPAATALGDYDRSQIIIVAAVGIVSLLIMLIFRDTRDPTAANASTLTQLRDFVSGSVGFLISCSTSHTGAKPAA